MQAFDQFIFTNRLHVDDLVKDVVLDCDGVLTKVDPLKACWRFWIVFARPFLEEPLSPVWFRGPLTTQEPQKLDHSGHLNRKEMTHDELPNLARRSSSVFNKVLELVTVLRQSLVEEDLRLVEQVVEEDLGSKLRILRIT